MRTKAGWFCLATRCKTSALIYSILCQWPNTQAPLCPSIQVVQPIVVLCRCIHPCSVVCQCQGRSMKWANDIGQRVRRGRSCLLDNTHEREKRLSPDADAETSMSQVEIHTTRTPRPTKKDTQAISALVICESPKTAPQLNDCLFCHPANCRGWSLPR
jgi:hypothetical protein